MNGSEMNRFSRMLLFICLLALLTACSHRHALSPVPGDAVVLAFGDSLTYGTGARPEESYPAILASLIGRRVVNAGVPGEVSGEGVARLPRVLEETRPALMILCLGGNDFLRQLDDTRVRDNLRTMVRMARERGVEVVLMAVPKLGFGLRVPDFFNRIAEEEKVPLEGECIEEVFANAALKSDPIHPNASGYRRIAESLARLLRENGAI